MFFDERRSHFLKDRLQRRLKVCQLDSFYAYYRLLTSREGRPNWRCCSRILPSTKPVSSAIGRSSISCKNRVLEEILRRKQERRDFTSARVERRLFRRAGSRIPSRF